MADRKSVYKSNLHEVTVYFAEIGDPQDPVHVGIVQSDMGAYSQLEVVNTVIGVLQPRVVISIGVGWGNPFAIRGPKDPRFGDVMVSKTLLDFTNNARKGKDGRFVSRSEVPGADGLLVSRFRDAGQLRNWRFETPRNTLAR